MTEGSDSLTHTQPHCVQPFNIALGVWCLLSTWWGLI